MRMLTFLLKKKIRLCKGSIFVGVGNQILLDLHVLFKEWIEMAATFTGI